ncbi:MAG: ABC transporter substrate-binding protein [Pseudomonadota bacterium]
MTRMRIARRAALTIACASLLSGAAAAQDKVKVNFGILTTASQAAFYVGVKQGIFAKYGFDATVQPLATGVQANQALASGQADWAGGGVESTIVAWATGLPFKAYAMYAKGGDSYAILVRNEAHIATPKDLKGKKVAVPQGTAPAQGLNQVLKEAGLPADSVKRVNATFANMGQMLASGAVDAMAGLEPYVSITQEKMAEQATILARLGKYVQGGGFFLISDKWAAAHPDKVADAVAALWESQQWVRQHTKEAAEIDAAFLKVDPHIAEGAMKWLTYDPLVDDFTAKSLQTTADYLAAEKFIPAPIKLEPHLADLNRVTKEVKAKYGKFLE